MKKLLHIIASPRKDESRTLQISEEYLEAFKQKHPDFIIDTLNLCTEELPDLNQKKASGKNDLMGGKNLFGNLKEEWLEITQHIERFLSADVYLISCPMWNFSIPYTLKHYIDIIVQPKYLFQYTDKGVEGLAKNKKMIVFASRGGQYSSDAAKQMDFQEPYLRAVFGFVGITDITFVKAEGMDMGDEALRSKAIEAAIQDAQKLAGI